MFRLRQLIRTTAVRLTIVYTVLFGLLAVGIVAYISYNTGQLLLEQTRQTIDEEVQQISRVARRAGLRLLIPSIERRSRRPGANLYLVADATGRIIAGNVKTIDRSLLTKNGWLNTPFPYEGFDELDVERRAIARVFALPGNLRLLVGRDVGEINRLRSVIGRALTISLIVMLVAGILLWFLVGRRALKHLESVSNSSQRIIAGDLSQRLPLSGSGDEFDRLSSGLNDLIARVQKLDTGMRDMSDSIAHDLRTPLTRLRNKAAHASQNVSASDADTFDAIVNDADALIKTFDALLMISQVDSGARPVKLDPVDLSLLTENIHELFEPNAEDLGVKLLLNAEKKLKVLGNRELLSQALTNLIDNAFKYGVDVENPTIAINLLARDESVVLQVQDNGGGIDPNDLIRIAERFVRLDQSRSKPGSGLGLALVDAITRLHDGTLQFSNADNGLRAEIIIPRPPASQLIHEAREI